MSPMDFGRPDFPFDGAAVLNPSGVTFELAQSETLGFDRGPRDGILLRYADRAKRDVKALNGCTLYNIGIILAWGA